MPLIIYLAYTGCPVQEAAYDIGQVNIPAFFIFYFI